MSTKTTATPVAFASPTVEPADIAKRLLQLKSSLGGAFLFHKGLKLADMLRLNERLAVLTIGRENKVAIVCIMEEANALIALRAAPTALQFSIPRPAAVLARYKAAA